MKSDIIQLLSREKTVSGEFLSDQLNVSRVTIWKHINKLRQAGYTIVSTAKGYQLKTAPDTPYSWEFPERQQLIHYFEEIPSTMSTAKELARQGCPPYSVVVADRQSEGRGRLERVWTSDPGGLYFTLILRPSIPLNIISRVSFAASLCLSKTIEKETGVFAAVKWPNDLLVDRKKLCGMLCEMDVTADAVEFLNVGIGINVNNNPEKWEPDAISLKRLIGKPVDRRALMAAFLEEIEAELSGSSLDHVIPAWKERAINLNRKVKVVTTSETTVGKAIDVDDNGALMVELSDGSIKKLYFGDCFIQYD